MAEQVYEWPREWSKFLGTEFALRTVAMRSQSVLSPRKNRRLTYQIWTARGSYKSERGPSVWQDKGAFFARLDGEVGLFRFSDVLRCLPAFNRQNKLAGQAWSDATFWSDGTGWLNAGLVPPTAELLTSARMGDKDIVIRGLPLNTPKVLTTGDLLELRPNGLKTETSNLYEVVRGSASNANGEAGVEVRPRLRQNFAAFDMVVLHHAQGVFQLSDSDGGRIFRESNMGTFGFDAEEYTG